MKNAIGCFRYLLTNGYDDPKKCMKEQLILNRWYTPDLRFDWDCMAIAIYFGNQEIIRMLEVKGIKKTNNPIYIEAALLSYRDKILKEILDEMVENNEDIQGCLSQALKFSSKKLNIHALKLLFSSGTTIDEKMMEFPIYYAVRKNSKELAKISISKGANLNSACIIS